MLFVLILLVFRDWCNFAGLNANLLNLLETNYVYFAITINIVRISVFFQENWRAESANWDPKIMNVYSHNRWVLQSLSTSFALSIWRHDNGTCCEQHDDSLEEWVIQLISSFPDFQSQRYLHFVLSHAIVFIIWQPKIVLNCYDCNIFVENINK